MLLEKLLAQYPMGAVKSVVCLERLHNSQWVVGKVYPVEGDRFGRVGVRYITDVLTKPACAKFGVHEMDTCEIPAGTFYQVNPHMKDGKLPTLVTGFNTNKVVVDDYKPVLSYKEIENLIRVGIDIQDALATNAPDLDRALVELWFELKGAK